ncbi:hypothetical protein KFV02_03315 [Desulfohalobiaceae bacterium Ax17]|jgi:sulfur carrier protein|uniref:hypothetical protein n=1 Tax=Desulfovulcanus ferrireducens TaxID=2831190 RepID=UPI00207BC54E|nr:hypothetical protein [Desulfovulcanus ferrireducens]MBT8762954.1 hypothetical protein [Desulfovulcanus ferrireducens]
MKVFIEPENKEIELPRRPKTVLSLLNKLNLRPTQALVIRDGQLLTPDRRLYHNDNITIRLVISRG